MLAPIKTADEFDQIDRRVEFMREPEKYRLLMLLSTKLGLRPMEMAGLDRNWFRDGELRIPLGHSKRKSGRSLPYGDDVEQALRRYMKGRKGTVFVRSDGGTYNPQGISDAFRRLYREAGVRGSCYSGRRTKATQMVNRGVPLTTVSAFLGHSSLEATKNYVQVTQDMVREAIAA